MKTEMKDRIRSRRLQLDMTQQTLADALGVSRVSVTKWESGLTKPVGKHLIKLALILKVKPEWILDGGSHDEPDDTEVVPCHGTVVSVPIISSVQAGLWTGTCSHSKLSDVISWTQTTASVSEEAFALMVRGESMTNPTGLPSIPEGAIVIVEPHYGPIDNLYGKVVVAMLEGSDEATVKKLVWDSPFPYLMPLNPAFRPIQIDSACRIIGKVVQVTQNL